MYLHTFEQFKELNENWSIRGADDFLINILKDAKSRKVITKFGSNFSPWMREVRGKGLEFLRDVELDGIKINGVHVIQTNHGNIMNIGFLENISSNSSNYHGSANTNIKLIVASTHSFKIDDIKPIFIENVEVSVRTEAFAYKRKLIDDHSQKRSHLSLYYVIYEYVVSKLPKEDVSSEKILASDFYSNLLKTYPVQEIGTKRQHKNGTLIFAIPTNRMIIPDGWKGIEKDKYWINQYGLFSGGTIRKMPKYGISNTVGRFSASSINGWKEAFDKLMMKFGKEIEEMEQKGFKVLNDEEAHKYRGAISARYYDV